MDGPQGRRAPPKDSDQSWKMYLLNAGVGLIILILSLFSVIVSDWVLRTFREMQWGDFAAVILASSVITLAILLIGALLLHVTDRQVVRWARRWIFEFDKSADKLSEIKNGFILDIERIVKDHRATKRIDELALVESEFEQLQAKFIKCSGLNDNEEPLTFRALGTMLGTYGEDGLGMAEQIASLFRPGFLESEEPGRIPFQYGFLGVPGHVAKFDEDKQLYSCASYPSGHALYPFSARVTACLILTKVCARLGDQLGILIPERLLINVRFLPRGDIFPAIQLWGNKSALVLCSTGYEDRGLAGAFPVAFMLNRNPVHGDASAFSLGRTLERLKRHLKQDFDLKWEQGKSQKPRMETWVLDTKQRTIRVENYCELCERETLLSFMSGDHRFQSEIQMLSRFIEFGESGDSHCAVEVGEMADGVGKILHKLAEPKRA